MNVVETHRAVLGRLLPADDLPDLVVRRGQFHDVVIGAEQVVCFARTRAAGERMPRRAAVLRVLSGLGLGFRTPQPLAEGTTAGGEPSYLVLSRVPGAPLATSELLRPGISDTVAAQYAALFRTLSEAGATEAAREALPHQRADRWPDFAEGVRRELWPLMSVAGRDRAEWELAALDGLPQVTSAVVHGDLGGENVLWEWTDGVPRLSGVVDWDGVLLGDQAEDLAAVAASYGDTLLAAVLVRLRPWGLAPADVSARISAIRGTFALQQALQALRDEDQSELDDGLIGYR
ncbi:hypothetical protein GCM10027290_45330 [Micromonospora sonneratiae]|uniref:Aminoglycoside phosphotransferase family protein n=1 Tax=Micromonospora sonneratiae TaxID=1184706 RepID=A0ABW3Y8S7_9ACTN